jgi:hypothetical protein
VGNSWRRLYAIAAIAGSNSISATSEDHSVAYLPVLEALERLCRASIDGSVKRVLAKHALGWLV